MRWLYLVVLAGACGPASAPTAAPGPINPTPPPEHVVDADAMCRRLQVLHDAKCGLFAGLNVGPTCPQEIAGSLTDPQGKITTEAMDLCTSQLTLCSDVIACAGQIEASLELRDCNQHDEASAADAVSVPVAEWRALMKRGVTTFAEVVTSKDKPLELCGVPTENYWLAALACADGSHPFATRSAAEQARAGNVGAGGRCGSIIDHYAVPCPERTYEIYIDAYVCPVSVRP